MMVKILKIIRKIFIILIHRAKLSNDFPFLITKDLKSNSIKRVSDKNTKNKIEKIEEIKISFLFCFILKIKKATYFFIESFLVIIFQISFKYNYLLIDYL